MRKTTGFFEKNTLALTDFFTAETINIRAKQLSPFLHLPFEIALFQFMAAAQRKAFHQGNRIKKQQTPIISFLRTNTAPGFVVIGQNQFAQRECKLSKMAKDGIKLVRRKTGGGAVFIDDGNVMFTLIRNAKTHPHLTRDIFFKILMDAINETFNVKAYRAGGKQNDIYVDNYKVAGAAFGHDSELDLYHTCILVSAKMEKLKNYLEVDLKKLQSKDIIDNNRQTVANLSAFDSTKTCQDLADNLEKQFNVVCGPSQLHLAEEEAILSIPEVHAISASMQDPKYLLKEPGEYNHEMKKRFSWGSIHLFMKIKMNMISDVSVYTDALDVEFGAAVSAALKGTAPITTDQVQKVIEWVKSERTELYLPALEEPKPHGPCS